MLTLMICTCDFAKSTHLIKMHKLFSRCNKIGLSIILKQTDDLEEELRHFLSFGKFIGVYPSGTTGTVVDRLTGLIPLLLLLVACVDLVGITGFNPEKLRTGTDFVGDFGMPGFYALGTFLYFYVKRNHHQLHELFKQWRKLKIRYSDSDRSLYRFVNISSFFVLTSAILENVTFHFRLFPIFDDPKLIGNMTSLQVYYERSHGHWSLLVPYCPSVAIILLITNKLALYAWNFADVLITVISRALHFRFGSISGRAESFAKTNTPVIWDKLWDEYLEMRKIVQLTEKFLSPIIFACYALNLYALCMQLHMWLTPTESQHLVHTIYATWSFLHLVARVMFVSVNAAKVHEEINRVERSFQVCPEEKYLAEVERLQFCSRPLRRGLGLSGLGCFLITKPFILSVFWTAFTFEIFLLQSDAVKIGYAKACAKEL